jgi:carbamoyl-phosphate synthase small subunit
MGLCPERKNMKETPAYLMLDDGTCFEGYALGMKRESAGEVVFTTAMAGYQETITDPSYHGQLVTFTAAHLGNYGISPLDDQSHRFGASGAIFHDVTDSASHSNWRAVMGLDDKLAQMGITGIGGVDTRVLTLHLRERGARNGIISAIDRDRDSLLHKSREMPAMEGLDLASKVTCDKVYTFSRKLENEMTENRKYAVAVYDYGIKQSILENLAKAGAVPTVWPAHTPVAEILASKPDGGFLSNGPGDPAALAYAVENVRSLVGKLPLFGICLGHQLLAMALGARTYKLKFGHHGANHPVKDLDSGRVMITSQNHGFCVDEATLPPNVRVSHWNLNDGTVEGIAVDDMMAFSVQFHPEAAPGPNDALSLFARFRNLMQNAKPFLDRRHHA